MSKASLKIKLVIIFTSFCVLFLSSVTFLVFMQNKYRQTPRNEYSAEISETSSKYADAPVVIIDAGHGGEDGGTVGVDGTFEKNINLAVALELDALLRAEGITTRLTRDTDTLLYDRNSDYQGHKKAQDAAARIAIAEEYENAVFISIHMNSFSQSKYSGLQVYYSENSPLSVSLADTVQSLVATGLQPNNTRKTKPSGENIYILKKIYHPAILIECGFLSNPEECAKLNTAEYRSKLCMVIYKAITQYFENTAKCS